jgi:hypothetical protein
LILYSLGQKKENSDELTVWGNAVSAELIPNDEYLLNITFNAFAQVSGWQDTLPTNSLHVSERDHAVPREWGRLMVNQCLMAGPPQDQTYSPTLFVYPNSPYYSWANGPQGMVIVCGGS